MGSPAYRCRRPIERIWRIDHALRNHQAPNCSRLARELGVNRKTVQRDIDYMRDTLGFPIEYDPAEHAYSYAADPPPLPGIVVTEGDMLALFVASQALAQLQGTPFERPLVSAFQKLAGELRHEFEVDLREIQKTLSIRHIGVAPADLEVFQTVSDAAIASRELRFHYHKLEGDAPESRRVQPYHLACVGHLWYLFAHDLDRDAIRTFALPRVRPPLSTGTRFTRPQNFSIADHLFGSFGVFSGDGDFHVRLSFDPWAGRLVREREWHPSQVFKETGGDRVELSLQLGSLEEIERWILGWGEHVRVIAPIELTRRVRRALRSAQRQYANAPELTEDLAPTDREHILRYLHTLRQVPDAIAE